jgi:ubiquinone/menaquinone biosynthesis C-methylase UbiE
MGKAEWGVDPEFFGPRHAHREQRIDHLMRRLAPSPGLHLECAAGVGSLSFTLARRGKTVVACDRSLRSLAVVASKARTAESTARVLPVMADITLLPFADRTFDSASSAETLEHIPDHQAAVCELARVLEVGGSLAGTVPAGPEQWSEWDDWAGHLRRYTGDEMQKLIRSAGLEPSVTTWGWPVVRLYDDLFLQRVNRRRLQHRGMVEDDPTLNAVSSLGRRRALVSLVGYIFGIDRLFDGAPWGVGLLFSGRKASP